MIARLLVHLVHLADTKPCPRCGHQMTWVVMAGGWLCGYCPQRG